VRFVVRAAGAASVAVIGSWNDWEAGGAAQRLRRTREPDLWEVWMDLPTGQHRYHFLVDGRAARPADAAQYRPDGFGGQDGVVEVP
jgi:1,4-alpha-glucan branching enzyme